MKKVEHNATQQGRAAGPAEELGSTPWSLILDLRQLTYFGSARGMEFTSSPSQKGFLEWCPISFGAHPRMHLIP